MNIRYASIPSGQTWSTLMRVLIPTVLVVVAVCVVAEPAHASTAAQTTLDPTAWGQTALDFLKKLWVFVIIAEIFAAMVYAFAFFTQSIFPSLYQTFQGDWVKKAVMIGIAVPIIMGALVASADSAMGGFQ